jgi:alkylation response protein AidB-like acyl-CoA dehydrogenase
MAADPQQAEQVATATTPSTGDALGELQAWLEASWSADLSVGEWWERLGLEGWAAPALPEHAYGRGLSIGDAIRAHRMIRDFGALGAPGGLGLLLAAPTIAIHGTQDQIDRYVRDIVTGQKGWCQLFSEPNAGSDLAGLQTQAARDGDEWVVNGQKVWTTGGHWADLGMLIARTDPTAPKHQGITYFAFDMRQPGVEIRPLREMTGRALFNEVFFTDARVAADAVIGPVNGGWAVANTTLALERAGLGAGGSGAEGILPGKAAGFLERRAGDLVGAGSATPAGRSMARLLIELAQTTGGSSDPTMRQELVQLYSLEEIGRFMNLRAKAARAAGADIAGLPNMAKLAMSDITRRYRDVGMRLVGPLGMLHAYNAKDRAALEEATGNRLLATVTETALFAQAPSIYGGTDEIQRNLLGERTLGLPREPGPDRNTPFRELPKNR